MQFDTGINLMKCSQIETSPLLKVSGYASDVSLGGSRKVGLLVILHIVLGFFDESRGFGGLHLAKD